MTVGPQAGWGPLEASVEPKLVCGASSRGSALSAVNVDPCIFGEVCPLAYKTRIPKGSFCSLFACSPWSAC